MFSKVFSVTLCAGVVRWSLMQLQDFFSNAYLIGGVVLSVALLIAGTYIPFVNDEILGMYPVKWQDWLMVRMSFFLFFLGKYHDVRLLNCSTGGDCCGNTCDGYGGCQDLHQI
jgi:magnesium-transporting ATPase (P-type)